MKYLIPLLIIGVILIWLGFYGFGILMIPQGTFPVTVFKVVGLLFILLFMGMALRVLVERLKELKEEEDDDYRQY
ncbi:hypothetical protein [Anoxynatronum sibiricum]|uniref:Uncharacterized protein n=1 Tax=Anoxynatronum sibiricum TaxID=210623 RepID=A0ABU9VTE5_9CLOT